MRAGKKETEGIIIREASASDIGRLMELSIELTAMSTRYDGIIRNSPRTAEKMRNEYRRLFKKRSYIAIVAECGGRVVGFVDAEIADAYSYMDADRMGRFGALMVEKPFRKMGIASRLLSMALEWFKSNGISDIYIEAHHGNTGAIRLYKKLGFIVTDVKLKYAGARQKAVRHGGP